MFAMVKKDDVVRLRTLEAENKMLYELLDDYMQRMSLKTEIEKLRRDNVIMSKALESYGWHNLTTERSNPPDFLKPVKPDGCY